MMTNDSPLVVSILQCGNDYLALSSNDNECSFGSCRQWIILDAELKTASAVNPELYEASLLLSVKWVRLLLFLFCPLPNILSFYCLLSQFR